MKVSKIVDKIKKYVEKDKLKKSHEQKLLSIIDDLKKKRTEIKEELKTLNAKELKRKDELEKKLQAISKVLKKSEKKLSDDKSREVLS